MIWVKHVSIKDKNPQVVDVQIMLGDGWNSEFIEK